MIMLRSTHKSIVNDQLKDIGALQLKLNNSLRNEQNLKREIEYLKSKITRFEKYINNLENTITVSEV